MKEDSSFRGLVFFSVSYRLDGDFISFQTVTGCHFAEFKGHDSKDCHSFSDDEEGGIERLGVPS